MRSSVFGGCCTSVAKPSSSPPGAAGAHPIPARLAHTSTRAQQHATRNLAMLRSPLGRGLEVDHALVAQLLEQAVGAHQQFDWLVRVGVEVLEHRVLGHPDD